MYEQRLRAETAEATRRRVLDALYDRLREAPSQPVSLDEVARRAGVARSTVYLVFGSRTGLFDALTDHLLTGAGYERILASVRDPDPRLSLRGGITGGVEMYAAHHEVFRILSSMAKLDPEGAGAAIDRAEARRAAGMISLGRRLHEAGLLHEGMTAEGAADRIWLFAGFDAFDTLATHRGLSAEDAAALLVDMAERALLRPLLGHRGPAGATKNGL